MNQSAAQRLKYASRVASIANGWKKWQGETQGINRLKGVEKKRQQEEQFQHWADDKAQYYSVLKQLHEAYDRLRPIEVELTYFSEAVRASDFMNRASSYSELANEEDEIKVVGMASRLRESNGKYFSDFEQHTVVDRAIFIETMLYMWKAGYCPYLAPATAAKDAVQKSLEKIYDGSIINNEKKIDELLNEYTIKKAKQLKKDPAVKLYSDALAMAHDPQKLAKYRTAYQDIQRLMRTYVKGLMEMQPDVNFFPDANLTLRVAYGHVAGFHPRDAVYYKPYSTLQGIMEKEDPNIYDYVVEPELKSLYALRDYGPYGITTATYDTVVTATPTGNIMNISSTTRKDMPVGFIATNHTTGGNSGSPVLNADGRLIGLNFDRCWEGTMSDLLFDPDYCRNICLDIRYCLFIIDKYAGAKHLVDEMTIVRSER